MQRALALDNIWQSFFPPAKSFKAVKTTSTNNFRFWLSVSLIAANVVLLGSYIYGVNENADQGYEIQSLQTQLANLNSDNRDVNLKVAEASSMVTIQNDFLSAGFVPEGTPRFLLVSPVELTER